MFAFLLRRCVSDINSKLTPDVANAYEAFLEKQHADLAKNLIEQYKKFLAGIKIPIWPSELENLNKKELSVLEQQYNDSAVGGGSSEKKTNWLKVLVDLHECFIIYIDALRLLTQCSLSSLSLLLLLSILLFSLLFVIIIIIIIIIII